MISRGESSEKWFILLWLNTLWLGSYHCILSLSALQYEMIDTFHLSDDQFALYTSIVFGFSAFISLFCPSIIGKIGIYNTMTLASTLVSIGQVIFICGIFYFLNQSMNRNQSLLIQYCGRVFLGIGYGIQSITIYTTVNIWFKDNQWLEFAINIQNITFDLGMLTARYCILPIYRASDDNLFIAYTLGFGLSVISLIGCIMMQRTESIFMKRAEEAIQSQAAFANTSNTSDADLSLHIELDGDLRKARHFGIKVWLIIIYIVIGWSTVETYINQFTLPLMIIFNISEDYSNVLLSVSSLCALTLGVFWGWLASKYGHLSYYLISTMSFMFISIFIIQIYDLFNIQNETLINNGNYIVVWIAIICFVIGMQHFFVCGFASLFAVISVEYSSIANSVSAVLYLLGSMFQAYLFGILVIGDNNGLNKNYEYSMVMMEVTVIIGLVIAIIVHVIDVIHDGPLHKNTNKVTEGTPGYIIMTDNESMMSASPSTYNTDHTDHETQPLMGYGER